jgi:hypothetical protein
MPHDVNDIGAKSSDSSSIEGGQIAVIEGGEISNLDKGVPTFDESKHRATTASGIAFALVGILAGTILLHCILITIAAFNDQAQAIAALQTIFDKSLPILGALVGGAVTYYFTREERR